MIARWNFYFGYAARSLLRSARWTIFAIFCIGAGVATVVALRSLGLAIGDTLIANARMVNHGDLTISTDNASGFNFGGGSDEDVDNGYSDATVEAVGVWARENGAQVAFYKRVSNLQVTAIEQTAVGRPQFITTILVDPATFSPAGQVTAIEPVNAPLSELLSGARSIVISANLAQDQGIAVGDTVRVSNTTEPFTVTGIVSTDQEASIENPIASFFGFVYLNLNEADTVQVSPQPNVVSVGLPEGITPNEANNELSRLGANGFRRTLPELLESYRQISDILGRFIVIMGLGALLIGGVGIVNTMLALVARRSNEIASLKTFGLTGRQILSLFMTEALLLGIVGSAVGALVGVGMSAFVNQYGEQFLQQRLVWRVYPEAIALGFALGLVVTLVFGILPVLTANRIRPAIILRPDETHIPVVGAAHSILALLLIVIVIGAAAGQIIGSPIVGMIGVAITLVILGVLTFLLWLLVWLVSRLPAFGVVDIQLALRNMRARRVRTATTLLALSAGMFALSSITFVGIGTREILNVQVTQSFGGNVFVLPGLGLISPAIGEGMLNTRLDSLEGIDYRTRLTTATATVLTVDGVEPVVEVPFVDMEDMPRGAERGAQRAFSSLSLQARDSTNPNLSSGRLLSGRDLTAEDRGKQVLVLGQGGTFGSFSAISTIPVGASVELSYLSGGNTALFEVVGIVESSGFSFGQAFVPPDVLPVSNGIPDFFVLQVQPEQLNTVLLSLSELPFVFTLDLSFIDGLLSRFIAQFSAIPTVVGVLSLLTAAVAMANTVSLSTLERRRQIGIMKAVGAGTRRVLGVMLLENTLVGLLGGAIGIGISALGVGIMTQLGIGDAIPIPRDAVPTAIALVVAAVVIAVVATLLSAQVAVREKVIEVLRYE